MCYFIGVVDAVTSHEVGALSLATHSKHLESEGQGEFHVVVRSQLFDC